MGPTGASAAAVLRTWVREFAEAAAPIVPNGSARLLASCDGDPQPGRYFGLGI
jgi:hypothetical protein